MPKLLIDTSVLCHIAWHRMASPNYEAKTGIEVEEFARTLTGMLLYYIQRFSPTELIFATDGAKYWRYAAYDAYYEHNVKTYKEEMTEATGEEVVKGKMETTYETHTIYYLLYDKRVYSAKYSEAFQKFFTKKLVIIDVAILQSKITENLAIPVLREDYPEKLRDCIPSYKGNRKVSSWKYTTPRPEFKKLCNSIIKNLAKTFSASYINLEAAEADDIAQVYHDMNSSENLIYITTDSDWHQLLRTGMFLHLFNPRKQEWIECSSKQAEADLAVKIMSGDVSDNILPISLKSESKTIGKVSAEKLYNIHQKNIFNFLKENADPDAYKRNLQLVFLKNCPKKLQKAIKEVLNNPPKLKGKMYDLNKYGLSTKEVMSIKNDAKTAREADIEIEEGCYE